MNIIKAPIIWELAEQQGKLAGDQIKIAILDTGIDNQHPMFNDLNVSQNTNNISDDYCALENNNFCNNKIILARSFLPEFPIALEESLTPKDTDGHGTHIAGIAAGLAVTFTDNQGKSRELQGLAPGAHLMIYKVLYRPASDPASAISDSEILLAALEQAYLDGADIINNSWGDAGQQHPLGSPEVQAIENLEDAGVLVINSAGNGGELGEQTLVCPACGQAGLAVASTLHGVYEGQKINYNNQVFYGFAGNGTALSTSLQAPIIYSRRIDEENENGCLPYPENTLNGKIALAVRGECSFEEKAEYARVAGALALLVMDNEDKEPFIMWMPDSQLPALLITLQQSTELLKLLDSQSVTIDHQITETSLAQFTHRIAETSSRGPSKNTHFLKPEIAAPGDMITSAGLVTDEGITFAVMSGTSMAAPHISGAAAALMGLHQTWSVNTIKSVITSTADTGISVNQHTLATPFDTGTGQINLASATNAGLAIDTIALVDNDCYDICDFKFNLTNLTNQPQTWHMNLRDNKAIKQNNWIRSVTLAADSSIELDLTVNITDSEEPQDWLFDSLQFTNLENDLSATHIPVVIKPLINNAALPLTTTFIEQEDNIIGVKLSLDVSQISETVQIDHLLPEGSSFINNSNSNSSSSIEGIIFGQEDGRLNWIIDTEYFINAAINTVELEYQLALDDILSTTQSTSIIDEDSTLNITLSRQLPPLMLIEQVSNGSLTQQLNHTLPITELTLNMGLGRNAEHGHALLNDNTLIYTPERGFYGEDQISIRIEDSNRAITHVITVNILINNINAVPEIIIENPSSVNENQRVNFDASNTYDDDIEQLVFHWQQLTGETVVLENINKPIVSFTAPIVSETTNLTFKLTVSDGVYQQEQTISLQVVKKPSSGGALSLILILIMLFKINCRCRDNTK